MKVTLIDYTGCGHTDPSDYAARLLIYAKNTRLSQGEDTRMQIASMSRQKMEAELDYIARTIRSSWEFVDYLFEVQGVTRAYTHQQVRTRTASYAQQAQRVVDMGEFETLMPATVKASGMAAVWHATIDGIRNAYNLLHANGVPAQDCRGLLPTNVLTNILVKVNLRTFADLVGKRENLRAQGEYADVVRAMLEEVMTVHPWVEPFVHPERTRTPALDEMLAKALGDASPIDKPRINDALKELDALKGTWG